jgi:hypothetical protein
MDIDTVEPGVDFRRVIDQAVGSCDVFIAVIGRHWLDAVDAKGRRRLDNPTDFVHLKIEAALTRDIPVVPVLVQGTQMPGLEELPETFEDFVHRNAVELSDGRWSYDVARLTEWLASVAEEKSRREQAREFCSGSPVSSSASGNPCTSLPQREQRSLVMKGSSVRVRASASSDLQELSARQVSRPRHRRTQKGSRDVYRVSMTGAFRVKRLAAPLGRLGWAPSCGRARYGCWYVQSARLDAGARPGG